MKSFFATAVKCYEEDGVSIVALGDDLTDPANFIIITRLDDEDNITLDDGVGFQTEQAEYEMPNAIKKVILRAESLEIVVKPEFVEFFGDSSFLAEIPQDGKRPESASMLKDALQEIFRGTKVDLIV
ncbi:hypothetical protein IFT86_25460 [Pseudomonas syringae]|uniref:hypothetical protein n=1 Tax=Pseudomonas syringae TaxID=317 RepID=UPI00177F5874|nr:hypothetical protein [Pseudomonas syringae]